MEVVQSLVPIMQDVLAEDEWMMAYMRHRLQRNMLTGSSSTIPWLMCRHILSLSSGKTRGQNFVKTLMQLPGQRFRSQMKVNMATFHELLRLMPDQAAIVRGRQITRNHRDLLITIWYLTTTEQLHVIGTRFGTNGKKVLEIVTSVCEIITANCDKYISWPTTEKMEEIADGFKKKTSLPGVIGVINTMHVPLKAKMQEKSEEYTNKAGVATLACQLVISQNGLIIDCFTHCSGRMTNVEVLEHSPLFENVKNGHDVVPKEFYLLGDSTYHHLPWLLTPFPEDETHQPYQKSFNNLLRETSDILKETFLNMGGRFRRLKQFDVAADTAATCLKACFVIHNVCLKNGDLFEQVDGISICNGVVNGVDSTGDDPDASLHRTQLAQQILSVEAEAVNDVGQGSNEQPQLVTEGEAEN